MEARPIQGTDENAASPFFSPDGEWIGYFSRSDSQLKKIATIGGTPVTLCDATNPYGASWGSDDTILYGQPEGIMRVSANGGTPELVVPTEAAEHVHGPQMLPGGEWVLFTLTSAVGATRWDEAQIVVQSLESGERKILWEGGSDARYVSTGHLIYALEDVLFALPFDLASLEVSGGPVPIVEGVRRANSPAVETASGNYGFSDGGTLIYVPGASQNVERTLVWVNRDGALEPLGAPLRAYLDPRLSPDGNRLAVRIQEENTDIWTYDLQRRTLSRLTFAAGSSETPVWTPDGKWVTFAGDRDGVRNLIWRLADGSAEEEQLVALEHHAHANSWSPDGKVLTFGMGPTGTASDAIWLLPLEEGRQPTLFLKTPFAVYASRLSPDGHWIAYASDESGRSEIYVQPFPSLEGKWQLSNDGGGHPVWARNGRELFYRNGNKMMVVEVSTQPNWSAGVPETIFEGQYYTGGDGNTYYDVAPDGQRFLMIKVSEEQEAVTQINVVLNWFEELKRLVPTP
jgi:Tol biopolymer transport system component